MSRYTSLLSCQHKKDKHKDKHKSSHKSSSSEAPVAQVKSEPETPAGLPRRASAQIKSYNEEEMDVKTEDFEDVKPTVSHRSFTCIMSVTLIYINWSLRIVNI